MERDLGGGRVVSVYLDDGRCTADLVGPPNTYREGDPEADGPGRDHRRPGQPVRPGSRSATASSCCRRASGATGSPSSSRWCRCSRTCAGICRFYLMETAPHLRLYVTPVQIDPVQTGDAHQHAAGLQPGDRRSDRACSTPRVCPTTPAPWKTGSSSDEDYVQQSDLVLQERLDQLEAELDRFAAPGRGLPVLLLQLPGPDLPHDVAQHGPRFAHPRRRPTSVTNTGSATSTPSWTRPWAWPWTRSGRRRRGHGHERPRLRPLEPGLPREYLAARERLPGPAKMGCSPRDVDMLLGVDWARTRAYAIGINGLYLNLAGRESATASSSRAPSRKRCWPNSRPSWRRWSIRWTGDAAIKTAYRADQVYHGDMTRIGPDIVVGYYRGLARQQRIGPGQDSRQRSSRTTCSSGAATTASPPTRCRES